MRQYHRWLAILFGVFILWIAATGVVTQGARLYAKSERPAAAAPAPPPAAARPPQTPLRKFTHFVTELHSGEEFGIAGQLVSLVAGLVLMFFAISGFWMYYELYRGRLVRARSGKPAPGGKWFWK
jgi:uncharacterized iron-regulated membrane protein